jgi:hypothetical protein
LSFTNCDTAPAIWSSSFGADDYTITHIEAQGDGGLIYSEHDDFHLTFNECVWNHYYAGGEGGIIYGNVIDFQKIGTTALCATTNITADGGGAFFSSKQSNVDFSLSGCSLSCQTSYVSTTVSSSLTDNLKNGGRLMEFTGGTITLSENTIYNCYTDDYGGVIKMNGGTLVDSKSTYYNNAALRGGVFYCDGCDLESKGSTFYSNKAVMGGAIYVLNDANVVLEGITSYS